MSLSRSPVGNRQISDQASRYLKTTSTQPLETRSIQRQALTSTAHQDAKDQDLRIILSPEGVRLNILLAPISARIGALTIDLAILSAVMILLAIIGAIMLFSRQFQDIAMIAGPILVFLLRNFYFTFFEAIWNGQTPGKKALKIRVVSNQGVSPSVQLILIRNLLREIDLFLFFTAVPMLFVLEIKETGGLMDLGFAFILIALTFLPFLNRDKMRLGDFVANSWVIRDIPYDSLQTITSQETAMVGHNKAIHQKFKFTPQQLAVYGTKEMALLGDLLQSPNPNPQTIVQVTQKIVDRIGWGKALSTHLEIREFLQAFYTALRQKQETDLLYGQEKKDRLSKSERRSEN